MSNALIAISVLFVGLIQQRQRGLSK